MDNQPQPSPASISMRRIRRPAVAIAALLVAAALGAGATTIVERTHRTYLVPLTPEAISALRDGDVAVKGRVAEVFGNKFVLQDDSGRALIETGRRGESTHLVRLDDAVVVQGRFDHGFLHAAAITKVDGHTVMLDAPPPPPPPRRRDDPPSP